MDTWNGRIGLLRMIDIVAPISMVVYLSWPNQSLFNINRRIWLNRMCQ